MDAETRHQLKTNELAEWLSSISLSDRRTQLWIGILLIVVLGYTAWRVNAWQKQTLLDQQWATLAQVSAELTQPTSETFDRARQLIRDAKDPTLAMLARLRLASALIREAGANADDPYLTEAASLLQTIVDDPSVPAQIRAAALYELGTVHETRRELDAARKCYQQLIDEKAFAGIPYVDLARGRLDSLDELAEPIQFLPGEPPPATQPATQPATAPATQPTTQPAAP